MTIKVDLSSERMLGDQERAANRGFLLLREMQASPVLASAVAAAKRSSLTHFEIICCWLGISSLGIYLLLFPGALPVAGAEDERDLSAASHSSLFISKNSYSSSNSG